MSLLEEMVAHVDPETPMALVLWVDHTGALTYLWFGADRQGAARAARDVALEINPPPAVLPVGTLQ